MSVKIPDILLLHFHHHQQQQLRKQQEQQKQQQQLRKQQQQNKTTTTITTTTTTTKKKQETTPLHSFVFEATFSELISSRERRLIMIKEETREASSLSANNRLLFRHGSHNT